MYTLSEIWIYPIKSLAGISLSSSRVEMRGLRHDRRWMLVDESGEFITQREIPEMALLGTAVDDSYLSIFHRNNPTLRLDIPLDLPPSEMTGMRVNIWSDNCPALAYPRDINDWFSDVLKQKMRLVIMPESTRRRADGRYAPPGHYVSFADGFPFLVIGQASLDELNGRLAQAVPMNRFRPNFVVSGSAPFAEDEWSDFNIGDVKFRGVKPCARCTIITTDQETAARSPEPLKTLAGYRSHANKVRFGQNVVWMGGGETVKVGDVVNE